MEQNAIGKRCTYTGFLGECLHGIIVFVECYSPGRYYVYIKSENNRENCYKTTLEGKVPEFSYTTLRLSDAVFIDD